MIRQLSSPTTKKIIYHKEVEIKQLINKWETDSKDQHITHMNNHHDKKTRLFWSNCQEKTNTFEVAQLPQIETKEQLKENDKRE